MRMGPGQARALIQARLGRQPQDALESAIVLEAWGGVRVHSAFDLGQVAVSSAPPIDGRQPAADTGIWQATPLRLDRVGMMLAAFGLAVWVASLTSRFGTAAMQPAWRVALPLSLAFQALVMRRFLSTPDGLGRLRREPAVPGSLLVLAAVVPAVGVRPGGLLAASLILVWVSGVVFCQRGWGAPYAATLGLAGLGLSHGLPAIALVVGLTAAVIAVAAAGTAAVGEAPCPPAAWRRVVPATVIGGGTGVLILVMTAGARSTGLLTLLAVFPALLGSLWGDRQLLKIWSVVPVQLARTPVATSSRSLVRRRLARVLLGALARTVAGTAAASGVVLALTTATREPTHAAGTLLLATLAVGIVGFLTLVLDSCGLDCWAVAVMGSAVLAAALAVSEGSASVPFVALLTVVVALVVAIRPLVGLWSNAEFVLTRAGI